MPNLIAKDWSNKSILIAEDEESNYLLLHEILSPTKAKLIRAINGKEANRLFDSSKDIDLVLLDIKMPIMSGLETASHIRKKDKQTPIIAQTVFGTDEFRQKGKEAGFTEFITKPILPNKFLTLLAVYLDDI